jgi:NADPH:quinone reductase-like Zn-dependent oxidoreductase
MRRVVIHRPGGYERLVVQQLAADPVGPGQVRLAVQAAGVNYADCIVRMGLYSSAKKYVGWPITPGFEVAGTVAEVGEGVDDLEIGDPVMAVTRFGGYADDLVVPRSQVFARPRGWSPEEAAGFCAVHLTAYYALVELARPPQGATLLVHSAAGGVGTALCALGRHLGARVVGVVSGAHKVPAARAAGAHVVIDKSREDLWARVDQEAPQGYEAVFDANGVATLRDSYRRVRPAGRLVVYGFATMLPRAGQRRSWLKLAWHWIRTPRFDPLALTTENRSVMGFNLSYLFDHADVLQRAMDCLLGWADGGVLPRPPVTAFPMVDVAAAHRSLETGRTVGKLVLVP